MSLAISEMPLALFTTFGSIGAGAFVLLSVAFATCAFSAEQLKRIDRLTLVPLGVLLVAFVCSVFHLANPTNILYVFMATGSSPLSNEIVAAGVFFAVAVVYWLLAMLGKLNGTARLAFSAVVSVLAVVYAVFMGLAYGMETIPSWDMPAVPVQMVGYLLAGGTALGLAVLEFAGVGGQCREGAFKHVALALALAGAAVALGGLAVQMAVVNGLENDLYYGSDLVAEATWAIVVGVVCVLAATASSVLAVRGVRPKATSAAAVVVAFAGILALRLAFYAVEMSVGLFIG